MAEHIERAPAHTTEQREPSEHTRPATMGRGTRILLGGLAFLPIAIAVVVLSTLAGAPDVETIPGVGAVLYGGMLLMFLLVIFFGAFVMNNRRIGGSSKALWVAGFLLAGPIIIPLYWYVHVLHAPHRGYHN